MQACVSVASLLSSANRVRGYVIKPFAALLSNPEMAGLFEPVPAAATPKKKKKTRALGEREKDSVRRPARKLSSKASSAASSPERAKCSAPSSGSPARASFEQRLRARYDSAKPALTTPRT